MTLTTEQIADEAFLKDRRKKEADRQKYYRHLAKVGDTIDKQAKSHKAAMADLRDKFRDNGCMYHAAAVKTAEFGHGWKAIESAAWGRITRDEAKILFVGHTNV